MTMWFRELSHLPLLAEGTEPACKQAHLPCSLFFPQEKSRSMCLSGILENRCEKTFGWTAPGRRGVVDKIPLKFSEVKVWIVYGGGLFPWFFIFLHNSIFQLLWINPAGLISEPAQTSWKYSHPPTALQCFSTDTSVISFSTMLSSLKMGVKSSRKCVRAGGTILSNLVLYHTQASACVCSPGKNLDQQLLPVQTATFLKRSLLPLHGSIRELRILSDSSPAWLSKCTLKSGG